MGICEICQKNAQVENCNLREQASNVADFLNSKIKEKAERERIKLEAKTNKILYIEDPLEKLQAFLNM